MPEYSEKRHITAAELRAQGIPVPEPIPAHAFVDRDSYSVQKTYGDDLDRDGPQGDPERNPAHRSVLRMVVQFSSPFCDGTYRYDVDSKGNIVRTADE